MFNKNSYEDFCQRSDNEDFLDDYAVEEDEVFVGKSESALPLLFAIFGIAAIGITFAYLLG